METGLFVLIVMAALAALGAFAWYRWRRREHVREVGTWVQDFLVARYGVLPDNLHINCSDDSHWPVLVAFHAPVTGARHSMRFADPGTRARFALLSEKEEARPSKAPGS